MDTAKVMCVGFQRTGTTSLGGALELLGLRVCGAVGTWMPDIARRASGLVVRLTPDYDAFEDNPWPLLFGDLDAAWPDARFVLTLRSSSAWLASMRRYFTGPPSPMQEWLYGSGGVPASDDRCLLEVYARHNEAVVAHFSERRGKLLVLDVDRGLCWEPLCRFLGLPQPDVPFPRLNAGATGAAAAVPLRTPQPIIG